MTKLTLEQQELLFANDCKLINLRYEYHGYTGTEKWAIVTELAEEELWVKYPDVIRRYTPFILLSMAQGEVITEYQNYEASLRNSSTTLKVSKMRKKVKLLQCPSLKLRLNSLTQWQRFKKRAKLKKKSLLRTVQMKTPPCSQNCYQIRKQQHY